MRADEAPNLIADFSPVKNDSTGAATREAQPLRFDAARVHFRSCRNWLNSVSEAREQHG
jgi:hypothetical protein